MAKILSHNLGIIYFLLPTTNFLALAPINNAIILLIAHKLGRGVFILQIGSWFIAQNSCFTFSKMLLTSWLTQRFPMENQNQTFTFFLQKRVWWTLLNHHSPYSYRPEEQISKFVHFFSIYLYKECKTCCFRKSQILQIYIGPHATISLLFFIYVRNWLFVHWPLTILYSLGYTSNK